MTGVVLEASITARGLRIERGFIVVMGDDGELGRLPLDSLLAVIGASPRLYYTHSLLTHLSQRNIPLLVCGRNYYPAGILWTVEGNHRQAAIMAAQAAASKPLRKRLWRDLVKAKIRQQAAALESVYANAAPLRELEQRVRSGDSNNIEAQAASKYWTAMMGEGFRRDRDGYGINAHLNYAYTILRAAVSRSVMAAGLHPSIGIYHKSAVNTMCLVDDLIEPFRPLADCMVRQVAKESPDEPLETATKRFYSGILLTRFADKHEMRSLVEIIQRLATSLAKCYWNGGDLELPPEGMAHQLAKDYAYSSDI